MKQRITVEDLQQLTDKQKQKLREWWKPQEGDWFYGSYGNDENGFEVGQDELEEYLLTPYCVDCGHYGPSLSEYNAKPDSNALPLLSIGQMIELLENKDECLNITKRTDLQGWGYEIQLRRIKYCNFYVGELVDALWQAVKEVL